jgi:hypothetical protein
MASGLASSSGLFILIESATFSKRPDEHRNWFEHSGSEETNTEQPTWNRTDLCLRPNITTYDRGLLHRPMIVNLTQSLSM